MATTVETPLDRLLDPVARCFTVDVARRLAEIRPDPLIQARIDELAAKASDGTLSAAEQTEYYGYVEAIDIVSILQAKARKVIPTHPVSPNLCRS
jgi:hypothetical protein